MKETEFKSKQVCCTPKGELGNFSRVDGVWMDKNGIYNLKSYPFVNIDSDGKIDRSYVAGSKCENWCNYKSMTGETIQAWINYPEWNPVYVLGTYSTVGDPSDEIISFEGDEFTMNGFVYHIIAPVGGKCNTREAFEKLLQVYPILIVSADDNTIITVFGFDELTEALSELQINTYAENHSIGKYSMFNTGINIHVGSGGELYRQAVPNMIEYEVCNNPIRSETPETKIWMILDSVVRFMYHEQFINYNYSLPNSSKELGIYSLDMHEKIPKGTLANTNCRCIVYNGRPTPYANSITGFNMDDIKENQEINGYEFISKTKDPTTDLCVYLFVRETSHSTKRVLLVCVSNNSSPYYAQICPYPATEDTGLFKRSYTFEISKASVLSNDPSDEIKSYINTILGNNGRE